jgi:ABC-type uncharacterized transport system ATPase subunit
MHNQIVCFTDRCSDVMVNVMCWLQVQNTTSSIAVGGANIQIAHYFDHGYLEEEKSMIHSFTVTFRAKYLTAMITNVTPYETCSLIKNKFQIFLII